MSASNGSIVNWVNVSVIPHPQIFTDFFLHRSEIAQCVC